MAAQNRWRIAIETERILVIAKGNIGLGRCERCGRDVELFTAKNAVRVLETSFDRIDEGYPNKFVLGRNRNGIFMCLKSLLRFLQSAEGENVPGDQPQGGGRQ